MFHLESNRIKREFKIVNNNFFASQIINKYSGTSFIPGGNGCEFVIRFTDGSDFSAKGLPVVDSVEEDGKLKFVFDVVICCFNTPTHVVKLFEIINKKILVKYICYQTLGFTA